MRVWDEDHPEWTPELRDFARAWRSQPKWVVSRSLKSVGPNATLVVNDVEAVIRGLKIRLAGELAVGGPYLARSLFNRTWSYSNLVLLMNIVSTSTPSCLVAASHSSLAPRPPLRLMASDLMGESTIRLTYVPA